MRVSSLVTAGFILCAVFAHPFASAQSETAKDYSFTISTAQPWTDTGVDLQAGEILQINASAAEACDPAGISGTASTDLPVISAPAGALIAKLQSRAAPLRVGSGKQLNVDEPGHLFLGVNASGAPPCNGSFSVKIHVTSGSAPATPVAGNSLIAGSTASRINASRINACRINYCRINERQFGVGSPGSRCAESSARSGHQVEAGQCGPGFSRRTIRQRSDGFPNFLCRRACGK